MKPSYTVMILLVCLEISCVSNELAGQNHIEIPYYAGKIRVDGKITDWKVYGSASFADTVAYMRAPAEYPFELTYDGLDISTILPPKSRNKTEAKFFWNQHGLYLAFGISDSHLMAEINKGNDNPEIFLNDGIEIYVDTRNDSHSRMDINDYQFIVDIYANYIAFKGDRRFQDSVNISVPKEYGQNIMLDAAGSTSGTINDSTDIDHGFILEIRIPFEAIGIVPLTGSQLKLDLCNNDNDYFLNRYHLNNLAKVITRPYNWMGYNNFGYPDYWKTAQLTGGPDWFERNITLINKRWVLFFVILSIFSVAVIGLMFISIRRNRRIPAIADIAPSKLIFIREQDLPVSEQTTNQRYLQKASDFIIQNSGENINSEKIAAHLGISLRKFQRITKEELNCTPTSFIYLVKLNKAAELIRHKTGNIAEIAYSLGFSSPSYFSKIFRSRFGLSPVEYQKSDKSSDNSDTTG